VLRRYCYAVVLVGSCSVLHSHLVLEFLVTSRKIKSVLRSSSSGLLQCSSLTLSARIFSHVTKNKISMAKMLCSSPSRLQQCSSLTLRARIFSHVTKNKISMAKVLCSRLSGLLQEPSLVIEFLVTSRKIRSTCYIV
jgi:hypothetical protein